jgi:RNA polymerase sigma factor (sigma-70 family)
MNYDKFVKEYGKLIESIAVRYYNSYNKIYLDREDFIQEAYLKSFECAKRKTNKSKMSTYLVHTLNGEMLSLMNKNISQFHIPKNLTYLAKVYNKLENDLGRKPTENEFIERYENKLMGNSFKNIELAASRMKRLPDIYDTMLDVSSNSNMDSILDKSFNNNRVKKILDFYVGRDKDILTDYFYQLETTGKFNGSDTARKMGIVQQYVNERIRVLKPRIQMRLKEFYKEID